MTNFNQAILGVICGGFLLLGSALACAQELNMTETHPGAELFPEALRKQLAEAVGDQGPDYEPRTRHLHEDGSARFTNRLILDASPYLLQHAHNPVNWYPWGEEAFETAKRLDRPILLSVGYSTCHWCHVMEEESFEDLEIAEYLNAHYVAIKVDREQRPDVDSLYMTAVQALTGGGGWPMTVWLTPDMEPFHGATYIPPRDGDRGVRHGFLTQLGLLRDAYYNQRERVDQASASLTARIQAMLGDLGAPAEEIPGSGIVSTAATAYAARYDREYGGLSQAPKFPSHLPARLMLRAAELAGEFSFVEMAAHTLHAMAAGGMYDQLGGGFHRYSTDRQWLVPHFEKMLYDNALLVPAYLEAYQASGDQTLADIAVDVLTYLDREMSDPGGGFYSATDADSENPEGEMEEGWFFTWTPAELVEVLGEEAAGPIIDAYGVTEGGNFEGRSILHLGQRPGPLDEDPELRQKLLDVRSGRPAPLLDDKVLTSWNGLAISAFARAGMVLDSVAFVDRASRAARFLLDNQIEDGRLRRVYRRGTAQGAGTLDDYAFLIAGLLDLYEASGDVTWAESAASLQTVLDERFWDEAGGGYFLTPDDAAQLLAREKPAYDGAEPSGNSVAAMNLLRWSEMTGEDHFRQRADDLLMALASRIERAPTGLAELLLALDFRHAQPKEVVLVAADATKDLQPFRQVLRSKFRPHLVVLPTVEGEDLESQFRTFPILEGKYAIDGQATAYVCQAGTCKRPVTEAEAFADQLSGTLDEP